MDISVLKSDEIEVEYEVRGIDSGSPDAIHILVDQIASEGIGNLPLQEKMHPRASKRPDLEIENCRTKLIRLQQDITELKVLTTPGQAIKAHQIVSRLLHVRGRLIRASQSPTYREQAKKILQNCEDLLSSLDNGLKNDDVLNESIEKATQVEIEETPTGISSGLDENVLDICNNSPAPSTSKHVQNDILIETAKPSTTIKTVIAEENSLMLAMMTQLTTLSEQLAVVNRRQDDLQAQLAQCLVHRTDIKSPLVNPPRIPALLAVDSGNPTPSSTRFEEVRQNQLPSKMQFTNPVVSQAPAFIPPEHLNHMINQKQNNFYAAQPILSHQPAQSSPVNIPQNQMQNSHYMGNTSIPPAFQTYSSNHNSHVQLYLSKSGISYDGSPTGLAVDMFLFQFETVASSLKLSPEAMMFEMHFVLKGVALQFYWVYRKHNPMASWTDFRRDFIERFQDRRSNYEIRRAEWSLEINTHTKVS